MDNFESNIVDKFENGFETGFKAGFESYFEADFGGNFEAVFEIGFGSDPQIGFESNPQAGFGSGPKAGFEKTDFETLSGMVDSILYAGPQGDFTVFSITAEDGRGNFEEVVCTVQSAVNIGEQVKLYGLFVIHPTYGHQFKASVAEKILPQTESGMEKYLASGVIKGIGEKRAKAIMAEFGTSAFDIIENNPAALSKIRGISPEKAMEMGRDFAQTRAHRNTIMYLQSLGLTAALCRKIYDRYGHETIDRIKENPYILARDIFGIGFKTADSIALGAGFAHNSIYRISAGISYVLLEAAAGDGHVYLPKEVLLARAAAILGIEQSEIENHILQLQLDGDLKQDKGADGEVLIYLAAHYHAEVYTARKLLELNQIQRLGNLEITNEISEIEAASGMKLAKMQKVAVYEALNQGVVVITGGPGTGKTTTIKTIIKILQKSGQEIILCAPTGRAAKRMSEATGMSAATIHRLLGLFLSEEGRVLSGIDDDMTLKADCIIVDESSMVDIMLIFRLLKYIAPGTKLVLVGDVNQLPSVGPGNVLKDIIASDCVKSVYLDEIFRQGLDSAIVMNAHRINQGQYPAFNDKSSDFFFIKEPNINNVVGIIADLAARRLPNFLGVKSHEIQILCPQRKTACGVENLNKVLQNTLNPPCPTKNERQMGFFTFREGDKVMHIKNNYGILWQIPGKDGEAPEDGLGIFNGDEGRIERIDNENSTMRVVFYDDKVVNYDLRQLDELVLAYAITIHKSQGSEYDAVIIPIHSGTPLLYNRNLLYTAITRAKKLVVIVGMESTICRMVDNIRENVRYSALSSRLIKFQEIFGEVS